MVYGEALEIGGTVTFRMDGVREETYPIEGVYDTYQGKLLLQECSTDQDGNVPEAEFNLVGKKIVIREVRLEFIDLN